MGQLVFSSTQGYRQNSAVRPAIKAPKRLLKTAMRSAFNRSRKTTKKDMLFKSLDAVKEWADSEVKYFGILCSDGGIATDEEDAWGREWLGYCYLTRKGDNTYLVETDIDPRVAEVRVSIWR